MRITTGYKTLLLSCVLLGACTESPTGKQAVNTDNNPRQDTPLIITSNYPLYFIASEITRGVERAPQIVFPDISGDPANWHPTPAQIEQLQQADLVLLNGAGAESWLDQVTLRKRQLMDTTGGLGERLIELSDTVVHQHGPEGEHSHQGTAFTTWLDPRLFAEQAASVAETLTSLSPELGPRYRENLDDLSVRLAEIDHRLEEVFTKVGNEPVLFSHPVYQYMERRYALNGTSMHWEPGEDPGLSEWVEVQRILASEPITLMFWEDDPLAATAEKLSELGVRSIPFHTAANRHPGADFARVMLDNAERLEAELADRENP